jgi:hypothetical protein
MMPSAPGAVILNLPAHSNITIIPMLQTRKGIFPQQQTLQSSLEHSSPAVCHLCSLEIRAHHHPMPQRMWLQCFSHKRTPSCDAPTLSHIEGRFETVNTLGGDDPTRAADSNG